jgi:methionyl-tRNA formyltransferase
VVFFGTDNISLHTFSALHAHTTGTAPLLSRLELVCTPDRPHRSKKVPCATKAFALQHQLTVHQVPRSVDFRMRGWCCPFMPLDCLPVPPHISSESFTVDQFDYSQPFDVGVVASFGYFIPPRVIASFRYGMINMHPSLLPEYVPSCKSKLVLNHIA